MFKNVLMKTNIYFIIKLLKYKLLLATNNSSNKMAKLWKRSDAKLKGLRRKLYQPVAS